MSENRLGLLLASILMGVFWVVPMVIYAVLAWG